MSTSTVAPWLRRERRERTILTWLAAALGLIAGIAMTLGVVHIARDNDPCVQAAVLANDAYHTGTASVDLDAEMARCADSVGGF